MYAIRSHYDQFCKAAVGDVIVGPAGRIVIEDGRDCNRQRCAVAHDEHLAVAAVRIMNPVDGRNDPFGDRSQRLAAGRRKIRICGGHVDEIITRGQFPKRQIFPFPDCRITSYNVCYTKLLRPVL